LPEAMSSQALADDCGKAGWALDSAIPLDFVGDYTGAAAPVTVTGARLTCLRGSDISNGADILVVKRTAAEPSLSHGVLAARLTRTQGKRWYLRVEAGGPETWVYVAPAQLFSLASNFAPESYWRAMTRVLFIRKYSDSDQRSDDIPTLCIESLAGHAMRAQCFVEGIEDMQYEFGLDTDADGFPDRYSDSPTATEIDQAVTTRVYLLVRSLGVVTGWVDEESHVLGRKVVAARHDAYLRRVFSTTVLLRNLGTTL
ncbi:MAG: PilW family protein, partial [Halioglobus sp.]|nr:PilW family protein [Halioglobus sp.]